MATSSSTFLPSRRSPPFKSEQACNGMARRTWQKWCCASYHGQALRNLLFLLLFSWNICSWKLAAVLLGCPSNPMERPTWRTESFGRESKLGTQLTASTIMLRAILIDLSVSVKSHLLLLQRWANLCCESCSVMSDFLWPHGLYSPWNSPGQNTGVDSLFLLQPIFPTQGSNPGLPHCRQSLSQLSHKGSPRILE